MKRNIAVIMLVSLLAPLLGGIGQFEIAKAATPPGTVVPYNLIDDANDYEYGGLLFSVNQTKNTVPISITAPSGQVIKSLAIYDKAGNKLRNVNGFTPGSKSYHGTETLQGTRVKVESLNNGHYGTIYYWDRSSGSHNWRATNEQFIAYSNECGRTGVPTDNFGLRKFPGCTDNRLESKIPISSGFNLVASDPNAPGNFWIPNRAVSPTSDDLSVNYRPVDDLNQIAVAVHGGYCTYDPTTEFLGVDYPSSITDSLKLKYKQSFESFPYDTNGDKQYKDWAAPGARQIWYCARFEADFYSYTYMYQDKKIYVEYQDEDDETVDPPIGGGSGSCAWTIAPPSQGSSPQTSHMNPSASGVIRADNRGSERFNVAQGIPTSETLYSNVFANNYLFQHTFANMSGKVNYQCNINITYVLQWQVPQSPICGELGCTPRPPITMTDTVTKPYNFTIQRDYTYWEIKNLEVYAVDRASVSNYALPGGSIMLHPTGYSEPSLSTTHSSTPSDHVRPKNTGTISYTPPVLNGGTARPTPPDDTARLKSMAESQTGDPDVRNDTVIFNGSTIMNGNWTSKIGPTPGSIPAPTTIDSNVLYSSGLRISSSLLNANNTPSSGTIYYDLIPGNVKGGNDKQFSITGINTVTVHTPVVNQASVFDDRAHNQKTQPTAGRAALILDRPFMVSIPTNGAHRNIAGYGNRDYAKYMRDKQVWFPFDVYRADRKTLIPKETWISIPVGQLQTTFYLPVWVDEGNYDVLFRTFAENSPSSFTSQMNANLDLTHHVATQLVPVEVIGRVYDFRITDIADFNWETVFRTQRGSAAPTGNAYWVGTKGIDGADRGNQPPFVLPVRPGSHPESGKRNLAIKTGYHFKFEVKTKGNMFGSGDGIKITPSFYFVDSKGRNRQEVDLYYHSGSNRFIRIGSSEDVERRHVTMDTRLRNMPQQELTNTAASLWALNGASGNRQTFINQHLKDAKQPVYVGGYEVMLLPQRLRTFIGSMEVPSGINVARAHASVQRWVGEYSLPAAPYAVPKGFNLAEYGRKNRLDDKSPIFLRDGYIIVNFKIETIRNQQVNQPHLQYIHAPLSNQWQREGFQNRFVDPYGATFALLDGDVVFYHANLSSYDDFGTGGTH